MSQKFILNNEQIAKNISALQSYMKKEGLDYFYISSFDPYLNEYVPLVNCHRYYISGFDGSTAETVVPVSGKVKLYVDGRYHEQADLQVDHNLVEVRKTRPEESNTTVLMNDLKIAKANLVGYEADRTSLNFSRRLEKEFKTKPFLKSELSSVIEFGQMPAQKEIQFVEKKYRGRDTKEKLDLILKDSSQAYFLTALDGIAWVTNCRGYHLPNNSCFMARALMTKEKIYVFVDKDCLVSAQAKQKEVEFINVDYKDFSRVMSELKNKLNLSEVILSPALINSGDYLILKECFGEKLLKEVEDAIVPFHSIKEPAEMEEMRRSFRLSDKAIFQTISWVREQLNKGVKITELDYYKQADAFYAGVGSVEQSFKTIAAVGANSSIIHFGSSSDDVVVENNHLMLLDSGAYYEGGFATDTTRAFFANPEKVQPSDKQKEVYTLVLKGLINAMTAVVKEGTRGMFVDTLARNPILRAGYDYAHGTGHGVGINVHESGARFSSISVTPIKKGTVVSIEPGIYLPGFGGVRLENIIHVIDHPSIKGMLSFECLVYVGFDPSLINIDLLSKEEIDYLKVYEAECDKRGTSFGCTKVLSLK
ncbi:MAG: M24 family metallopeptidase [Bacteriovoracaceae bacterium]